MRVDQLWNYPVKSMIGTRVNEVIVSPLGIVGDRHWAIRDTERGGIRGAKKIGELMQCAARRSENDASVVVITLPNGHEVSSDSPDINQVLSDALGRAVLLQSLPADNDIEHFRRGPADTDDVMQELRGIFGRDEDEPLPDFSVFPPEVATLESPLGTHHDCWPLLVMTTSAMSALQQALPESVIDVLRFRPSIMINTPESDGHPEFSWKGRTARIGSVVVEFLDPCPRCVMITRRINDAIPQDRSILRHVVRDLDQNVGVYARVVTPGEISVGNELDFL
ncbi:MAG: MOSC domain-containing protein [Ilumatobacteraceae bacterium]